MKNIIIGAFGAIGAAIAWLFGGWTMALTTLLIFMAIDYITGVIVAGVFHKSGKSKTGSLSSIAGINVKGESVVLTSTDGRAFRLTVSDSGAISAVAIEQKGGDGDGLNMDCHSDRRLSNRFAIQCG